MIVLLYFILDPKFVSPKTENENEEEEEINEKMVIFGIISSIISGFLFGYHVLS